MTLHACFNPKCNNVFSDEHKSPRVHIRFFGELIVFCSKECYEKYDRNNQNYLTT